MPELFVYRISLGVSVVVMSIFSVKILCALGLVWVQQSWHVLGCAEPLRHLTVLKDCNTGRTRLFVTSVTSATYIALLFPLHWKIVWILFPVGGIQSLSWKLVNMSVCIQNAQFSPSVQWEAAWLCTHMRSCGIPTGVGSVHPFICDPKSFLRENVCLSFVIMSFASEIQQLMYSADPSAQCSIATKNLCPL